MLLLELTRFEMLETHHLTYQTVCKKGTKTMEKN